MPKQARFALCNAQAEYSAGRKKGLSGIANEKRRGPRFCSGFHGARFIHAAFGGILANTTANQGVVHVAFCHRYPLTGLAVSRKVSFLHHNE